MFSVWEHSVGRYGANIIKKNHQYKHQVPNWIFAIEKNNNSSLLGNTDKKRPQGNDWKRKHGGSKPQLAYYQHIYKRTTDAVKNIWHNL